MKHRHPFSIAVTGKTGYPAGGRLYLKLHLELALISFWQIQVWEPALDIASDCLSEWWMQANNANELSVNKQSLLAELDRACKVWQATKHSLHEAEQQFQKVCCFTNNSDNHFCIDSILSVLDYLPKIDRYEKEVIRLQLEEGLHLDQISKLLGKPLSTIKLLQSRAVYQLKKHFRPGALPFNQLR